MKKLFLMVVAVCATLFVTSCSDSKDDDKKLPFTPEEILKLPYSELTPEQQKVKLESDATELLKMADGLKSAKVIGAYESFSRFLNISSPEIVAEKKAKVAEDVFKYADAYGIHEWDSKTQSWVRKDSNSELKFIFPATASGKTNNATLSVNAKASDVVVDGVALPSSATGTVTVDGKEVAKIDLKAEYKDKKEIPSKMDLAINFDSYKLEFTFNKATENKLTASLKQNDKSMIYSEAGATINLDKILGGTSSDLGKANSYIQLMDNFVLVGQSDINNYTTEMDAINDYFDEEYYKIWYYNSDTDNYYYNKDVFKKSNELRKSISEKTVACLNKYNQFTLASIKDATKISTLEFKSEEDGSYLYYLEWDDETKQWESADEPNSAAKEIYYDEPAYLVFNDNTKVEAETYFSEGFSTFIKKWNEFIRAFN